jgi:predicted ATPase/transcriptional regulator with XRE-family HTH domain
MEPDEIGRSIGEAPAALGARLRLWRERRGRTQEELAGAVRGRMTARTIRNIERGKTRPYLYNLIALLDTLDVPQAERTEILESRRGRRSLNVADELLGPSRSGSSSRRWGSLPTPLTPMFGRAAERAAIATMLRQGPSGFPIRLLTLTGPGGVGKTRLVQEVAAGLCNEFIDGTAFVSFTEVDDPASVPRVAATAVGWDSAESAAPLTWLMERVRTGRMLLVLDGFEHLLAAAHTVTELLEACPNLVVMITSRSPLRLHGEHVFPLAPLALPTDPLESSPERLALVPSIAVFIDRAGAVQPRFRLTVVNAPIVAAICRRLDGLPLALELAAGRLAWLSPTALLAELENPLAVLVDGPRDAPTRRQALRSSLAWSDDLLTPAQQTLFRRLSVFAGGWTLGGACTLNALTIATPRDVAPRPGNPNSSCPVLESLGALIDHGLVTLEPEAESAVDDQWRYAMLRTTREYGLERLGALGEEPPVRRTHALWFADFVERLAPQLQTGTRDIRLGQIDREAENLGAALDWCRSTQDHHTALRLGGGLIWYWYFRGRMAAGRECLEDILAHIDVDERSRHPDAVARVLWGAGRMAHLLGDETAADYRLAESVALWRRVGDRQGLAHALLDQGKIAFLRGSLETARALAEESAALFAECGDHWGGALALQQLGHVAHAQREESRAESLYRQALGTFDDLGDSWGRGMPLLGLGRMALARNKLAEARAYLEESLAIFEHGGESRLSAVVLGRLGRLAGKEGDSAQAAIWCRRSIQLRCELGQFMSIGIPLTTLAGVANERGRAEDAARLWGAAEALLERHDQTVYAQDIDYQTALAAAIRRRLGGPRLAACRQEGRALHREQVVALALAQ